MNLIVVDFLDPEAEPVEVTVQEGNSLTDLKKRFWRNGVALAVLVLRLGIFDYGRFVIAMLKFLQTNGDH
jgi:hypothetical protein